MRNIEKNFEMCKLIYIFADKYVKWIIRIFMRTNNKLDILKVALEQIIDNIDSNNSKANDEQLDEILDIINKTTNTQNKLSKYQACKYLHISRATFDNWVRDGKIPEGRKEQGFKEKFWIKSDLDKIKNEI